MNEQENTKVIRQAYDYFKSGDIESVLGMIAEDVDWRLPEVANMPQSGTRKGKGEVTEFFTLLDEAQETKVFEPQEYIAQGDRVAALGHYNWKTRGTGREYASNFVHVFTVRDGKIVGFDEYFDTAAAASAFQRAQTA